MSQTPRMFSTFNTDPRDDDHVFHHSIPHIVKFFVPGKHTSHREGFITELSSEPLENIRRFGSFTGQKFYNDVLCNRGWHMSLGHGENCPKRWEDPLLHLLMIPSKQTWSVLPPPSTVGTQIKVLFIFDQMK